MYENILFNRNKKRNRDRPRTNRIQFYTDDITMTRIQAIKDSHNYSWNETLNIIMDKFFRVESELKKWKQIAQDEMSRRDEEQKILKEKGIEIYEEMERKKNE